MSRLILFGERALSRALAEFSAHYHGERNHQGKGNQLLFPEAGYKPKQRGRTVECRHRLGGLLKYYAPRRMNYLTLRCSKFSERFARPRHRSP